MSARAGLALLRAEIGKVWGRPILEITVALMAVLTLMSVEPITQLNTHAVFPSVFRYAVVSSVSATVSSLMLPWVIMCGVLMALSFAKDYESGLMQSLLSMPISRKMFFTVKFFAVVLPLVLLSWVLTTFFVGLSFYSDPWLVLQFSFYVLPVSFLSLMFCGGLGVLVALVVKRSIPAVLTSLLANFFIWYPTTINTLNELMKGADYVNYLCLTPHKGAWVFLNKLLGIPCPYFQYISGDPFLVVGPKEFTSSLEYILPASSIAVLLVFYACVLVIPMFVYFCRRFEICE
jgi:ABC-type transport system involved in multi-copper enzyme maturation permease subunit